MKFETSKYGNIQVLAKKAYDSKICKYLWESVCPFCLQENWHYEIAGYHADDSICEHYSDFNWDTHTFSFQSPESAKVMEKKDREK